MSERKTRKEIIVGGIGNPLMSDEGVGIHVIHQLTAETEYSNIVDFVDLGSSAMNVIHGIAGRKKAILIDCARMGEPIGTIKRFSPEEVISSKDLNHLSLHEGDLLDALALSQKLGECPEDVVIFGIQPDIITFGEELSPSLRERLPEYTRTVIQELNGELNA